MACFHSQHVRVSGPTLLSLLLSNFLKCPSSAGDKKSEEKSESELGGLLRWRPAFASFFFFKYFFDLFMALLIEQLKWVTGNRERKRGSDTQGQRPGVEPRSAAEPRHMGYPLYQLS